MKQIKKREYTQQIPRNKAFKKNIRRIQSFIFQKLCASSLVEVFLYLFSHCEKKWMKSITSARATFIGPACFASSRPPLFIYLAGSYILLLASGLSLSTRRIYKMSNTKNCLLFGLFRGRRNDGLSELRRF